MKKKYIVVGFAAYTILNLIWSMDKKRTTMSITVTLSKSERVMRHLLHIFHVEKSV